MLRQGDHAESAVPVGVCRRHQGHVVEVPRGPPETGEWAFRPPPLDETAVVPGGACGQAFDGLSRPTGPPWDAVGSTRSIESRGWGHRALVELRVHRHRRDGERPSYRDGERRPFIIVTASRPRPGPYHLAGSLAARSSTRGSDAQTPSRRRDQASVVGITAWTTATPPGADGSVRVKATWANSRPPTVCTGSASLTLVGVETKVPWAQSGVQVLWVKRPVAVAVDGVHEVHVRLVSRAFPSPQARTIAAGSMAGVAE